MSYNLVNPTTGDLTRVAGGGGTFYADLPIGSWIKNNMDTLPSGFLKEGDTISQSECPELYAKYGATVPYKADTSELDSYSTNVAYSTLSSSSGYKMLYDGFMEIRMQGTSGQTSPTATLTVNNSIVMQCGNYTDGARKTQLFFFRKGDVLKAASAVSSGSSFECKIAYYKKSLIVKAKSTPIPTDFVDAAIETNKYSTTETIVGKWIDNKPIYRKVVTNLNFGGIIRAWTTTGVTLNNCDTFISGHVLRVAQNTAVNEIVLRVNNNTLQYYTDSGWDNCDQVIIEYTKTTD